MIDALPLTPVPLDPASIRGLVFDLDGTLVDSYRAITTSLNHARSRFGLPPLPLEVVRPRVGWGLESLVAELIGPDCVAEGVREFRRRYAEVYGDQTFALPGARDTVRQLRARGYRLAVASNKPARFSEPILRRLGMLASLDAVQGPDLAGTAKPDPTMIRLCLHEMGVSESQAAYVGDMSLDVETATRAGLPVLLIPGGSTLARDLRRTGRHVLNGMEELLEVLPVQPAPEDPVPSPSAGSRRRGKGLCAQEEP